MDRGTKCYNINFKSDKRYYNHTEGTSIRTNCAATYACSAVDCRKKTELSYSS